MITSKTQMKDLTHEEMLETAQQREAANEHPEIVEVEWIDDTFCVEQKKWGTWETFGKDGKGLITGLDRDATVRVTRSYLKQKQDGTLNDNARVVNDGIVGGKL